MMQRPPQQPQRQVLVADVAKRFDRFTDDRLEELELFRDVQQVINGLSQRVEELNGFIVSKGLELPPVGAGQPAPFQPKVVPKDAPQASCAAPEQGAAAEKE